MIEFSLQLNKLLLQHGFDYQNIDNLFKISFICRIAKSEILYQLKRLRDIHKGYNGCAFLLSSSNKDSSNKDLDCVYLCLSSIPLKELLRILKLKAFL